MTDTESLIPTINQEDLKIEAKQFYDLSQKYKQEQRYRQDKEAYLLSKVWLRKWKKYVDYEYIKSENRRFSYKSNENKEYTPEITNPPGPIDNSVLLIKPENFYHDENLYLCENQVIRHDLDQANELRIVNKEIWDFFVSKYTGNPTIIKYLIEQKERYGTRKVYEIYYNEYNILLLPDRVSIINNNFTADEIPDIKPIYISRRLKYLDLKTKILKSTYLANSSLTINDFRLWKHQGEVDKKIIIDKLKEEKQNLQSGKLLPISDELIPLESETFNDYTLNNLDIENTDTIIVEIKPLNREDKEGKDDNNWIFETPILQVKYKKCDWCGTEKHHRVTCVCKEVWYCNEDCKLRDDRYHQCKAKLEISEIQLKETPQSMKGKVGLHNLGNTCFMNTALQCISNCYELSQYFLNNIYQKDISSSDKNPLSSNGTLARTYANLLKNLYFGTSRSFDPREFKKTIGTYQSMFCGYQQHDTQEFLNYLLDGLHEDLNRVENKPFIETDNTNKDDDKKAEEQWIAFLKRNQSVLVDLLYAQYKSTITCPECHNISIKYDPYLSITLPLPSIIKTYTINCFFIFYDVSIKPIQINLMFNTKTNIMAMRNKIAKMMNIHPMSFIVTKMDSKGEIDYISPSNSGLIIPTDFMHTNQKSYFIFQINPELFKAASSYYPKNASYNEDYINMIDYLKANTEKIGKLLSLNNQEQDETDSKETENYYSTTNIENKNTNSYSVIKYNIDNLYGFDKDNYLIAQIYMQGYDSAYKTEEETKNLMIERYTFPRLFTVKKDWSTLDLQKEVFFYFYPIIKEQLLSEEFRTENVAYSGIKEETINNKNDLFEYFLESKTRDINSVLPYKLYISSFYNTRNSDLFGLGTSNRGSLTLLPTSQDILIKNILSKIPKNKNNKEIDNTFLFMNFHQKRYSNLDNSDFYLQVVWNLEFKKHVKKLNDKVDFEYSIETPKRSLSLDDCFKLFSQEEVLQKDNEWYCPNCKKHVGAKVHLELYSTPPIMILHLKRFKSNHKIDTLINFEIENLDMNKYLIGPTKNQENIYDLFAVSHHYGGMGGGHYVASGKNYFDGQWYNFNDSSVSPESKDSIVSSSAYVLFYKRKDIKTKIDLEAIYNKKFIEFK